MDVLAVVGDDQVVIAAERMWGDFVPEGMAPLRSTTVYVVESGWLVGITRVLSAEQRDALTLAALADTVWEDGGGIYHRFDADGTYRNFDSLANARSGRNLFFSGTYGLSAGCSRALPTRTRVCATRVTASSCRAGWSIRTPGSISSCPTDRVRPLPGRPVGAAGRVEARSPTSDPSPSRPLGAA